MLLGVKSPKTKLVWSVAVGRSVRCFPWVQYVIFIDASKPYPTAMLYMLGRRQCDYQNIADSGVVTLQISHLTRCLKTNELR